MNADREAEAVGLLERLPELLRGQGHGELTLGARAPLSDGTFSDVWEARLAGEVSSLDVVLKIERFPAGRREPRADLARREHAILRELSDALEDVAGLGVPQPLALFDAENALVMERVPGDPLQSLLAPRWPWRARRARRGVSAAGRWLRSLQELPLVEAGPPSSPPVSRHDTARLAERAAEGGLPEELASEASAVATALFARSEPTPLVNCHGDYTPWNVLVGDGGCWVIDFSLLHAGEPEEDVALACESLPSGSLAGAFLRGYGREPAPHRFIAWRLLSRLYVCGWLRHHRSPRGLRARRFVGSQRREHERAVRSLIERARELAR